MNAQREFSWLFLVYVPRSGSTLFSRLISEHTEDIYVMPESRVLHAIEAVGEEVFFSLGSDGMLDILRKDPRWDNLGIAEIDALAIMGKSLCSLDLLNNVARHLMQRDKKSAKYVIYKSGMTVWLSDIVLTQFSNSHYLFVDRDPRGSVCSRLKNISLYRSKVSYRTCDVWYLSKYHSQYLATIEELSARGNSVRVLNYEDIVKFGLRDVKALLVWLDCGFSEKKQSGVKLSSAELADKHKNVLKDPIPSRASAWSRELSIADGVVIEFINRKNLAKNHYINKVSTLRCFQYLATAYAKHLWYTSAHAITSIMRR